MSRKSGRVDSPVGRHRKRREPEGTIRPGEKKCAIACAPGRHYLREALASAPRRTRGPEMRLLVIGGTGFLSGTVVREATAAGHDVSIVTRGRRPPPAGVEALVADRSDTPALAAALGGRTFDAVIDCIGFRPEDAAQDIELFAGRAAHLVFISTDFVYGGEPRRLPLTETAPTEALNPYGRNKRLCEELLLHDGPARGLRVTMLRPPHILGAGSHLGTGSLQGRDPMLLRRPRH